MYVFFNTERKEHTNKPVKRCTTSLFALCNRIRTEYDRSYIERKSLLARR